MIMTLWLRHLALWERAGYRGDYVGNLASWLVNLCLLSTCSASHSDSPGHLAEAQAPRMDDTPFTQFPCGGKFTELSFSVIIFIYS